MFGCIWAFIVLPFRLISFMFRMIFYPFRVTGRMISKPKDWLR